MTDKILEQLEKGCYPGEEPTKGHQQCGKYTDYGTEGISKERCLCYECEAKIKQHKETKKQILEEELQKWINTFNKIKEKEGKLTTWTNAIISQNIDKINSQFGREKK